MGMGSKAIVVGVVMYFLIVFALAFHTQESRNDQIDGCEKNLPRDQRCVLIAVPEAQQGGNVQNCEVDSDEP